MTVNSKRTVNFEYTDHLESIHPSMSVMVKYSVMAEVVSMLDEDSEECLSVDLTSIRGKVCSLLYEGEWEQQPIFKRGFNSEINKMIETFEAVAIQKYEELQMPAANE